MSTASFLKKEYWGFASASVGRTTISDLQCVHSAVVLSYSVELRYTSPGPLRSISWETFFKMPGLLLLYLNGISTLEFTLEHRVHCDYRSDIQHKQCCFSSLEPDSKENASWLLWASGGQNAVTTKPSPQSRKCREQTSVGAEHQGSQDIYFQSQNSIYIFFWECYFCHYVWILNRLLVDNGLKSS